MSSELAMTSVPPAQPCRALGRYLMYDEIASGGMASVHFGRLVGPVGFARTVAIKHLHPHYSADAEFVSMLLDEAHLAARIGHPNVAAPLDVVVEDTGEIFLVMEYVHGETLVRLVKRARAANVMIPLSVGASIMSGALHGLHAAHEAVSEGGEPLNIVHRDISPQNIIVGVDGVARVLDFGVAKAVSRSQSTRQGHVKGKPAYMAPEQLRTGPIDRRVDIFAAGIVLWETLTHHRLFRPDDMASALAMILTAPIERPSAVNPEVSSALDGVVMKALDRNVSARFQTARDFADAIEEVIPLASPRKVGEWVERLCSQELSARAEKVSDIERSTIHANPHAARPVRVKTGPVPSGVMDFGDGIAEQSAASGRPLAPHLSSDSGETVVSAALDLRVRPARWLRRAWPLLVIVPVVVLLLAAAGIRRWQRTGAAARVEAKVEAEQPAASQPAGQPNQSATLPPSGPVGGEPPRARPRPPGVPDLAATNASEPALPEAKGAASPSAHRRDNAKPGPRKPPKAGKSAGSKSCTPPYYVDPQGIRRVKPQCL